MAATILNSPRAAEVSIFVVRAFVKLRQLNLSQKEFAAKLLELERKLGEHDEHFRVVFEAIRQLMAPPPPATKRRRIGFHE